MKAINKGYLSAASHLSLLITGFSFHIRSGILAGFNLSYSAFSGLRYLNSRETKGTLIQYGFRQ